MSATFAVTIDGYDTAIGLIQVREITRGFDIAQWGFAIAPELWGTGAFQDAARLVLQFAFDVLGVHRMEARVFVRNGRGVVALRKLGAIEEGVLRQSTQLNGRYVDQVLCSIVKVTGSRPTRHRPVAPSLFIKIAVAVAPGHRARRIARPLAPRTGIEFRPAQTGVLHGEQILARRDSRAAVAHHYRWPIVPRALRRMTGAAPPDPGRPLRR